MNEEVYSKEFKCRVLKVESDNENIPMSWNMIVVPDKSEDLSALKVLSKITPTKIKVYY